MKDYEAREPHSAIVRITILRELQRHGSRTTRELYDACGCSWSLFASVLRELEEEFRAGGVDRSYRRDGIWALGVAEWSYNDPTRLAL